MEEPSVLDYLKSKLKFWEKGNKIEIPPEAPAEEEESLPTLEATPLPMTPPEETPEPLRLFRPSFDWRGVPWRALLALALILLAQRAFEPAPERTASSGLFLYGLGLAWVLIASLRGEWTLADLPEDGIGPQMAGVRLLPFGLSLLLSIVAFFLFGDNRFTLLNVSLWLAAMASFLWAFWIPQAQAIPWWKRLLNFVRREVWTIRISRWTLLVLAVSALVIFFRFYNLRGVPAEPFSDHAEKILDVYDVTQGETLIFFPRNTGREAFQMYLTVAVAWLFGTGLSFLSLKIGTVLCGLATLPYMYLLGKELAGKRAGLLALLFAGIAYWPNVISRVGLRFPLYPLFVAPTLYYLIRGLQRRNRNDFLLAGLFLGIGLHGYSPIRILPFVVVVAFVLYWLHRQSQGARREALSWLILLATMALVVFLPLLRFWLEYPDLFSQRAFSRLGSIEAPLPGPVWQVFLSNLWNGLKMFNWDDGEIWVHSVTHRPALDVVSGALFLAGVLLLLMRYIRQRHWLDLFLLLSVPLLQMPSILSLAFPAENPALNRASGAMVPTFLIIALALDGLWRSLGERLPGRGGALLAWGLTLFLVALSIFQNYHLVFRQYAQQFVRGAWNTSEMGAVIKQFGLTYGTTDTVWIVPYPHWVDTRLPGVWAGIPNRDFGLWPENLEITLEKQGPKLFIVNVADEVGKGRLEELYPRGVWSLYISRTQLEGKNFLIYFVPPEE